MVADARATQLPSPNNGRGRLSIYVLALIGLATIFSWILYAPVEGRVKKAPATMVTEEEIRRVHAAWSPSAINREDIGEKPAGILTHKMNPSRLEAVEAEAAETAPTPSAAYEHPPEPESVPPPSTEEAEQRLFDAWAMETDDPAWTEDVSQSLAEILSDAGLPAERLKAADCRQTICRLEFAFEHRSEAGLLHHHRTEGLDLVLFSKDLRFVVFVGRPGVRLQRLYSRGLDETEL